MLMVNCNVIVTTRLYFSSILNNTNIIQRDIGELDNFIELKHQWSNKLDNTSNKSILKEICDYFSGLPDKQKSKFASEAVPSEILCLLDAFEFRKILTTDERLNLVIWQYNKTKLPERFLLEEGAAIYHLTNGEPRRQFWNIALKFVEQDGFLWSYAPVGVKNIKSGNNRYSNNKTRPTRKTRPETTQRESKNPYNNIEPSNFSSLPNWSKLIATQSPKTFVDTIHKHCINKSDEQKSQIIRGLPVNSLSNNNYISLLDYLFDQDLEKVLKKIINYGVCSRNVLHLIGNRLSIRDIHKTLSFLVEETDLVLVEETKHKVQNEKSRERVIAEKRLVRYKKELANSDLEIIYRNNKNGLLSASSSTIFPASSIYQRLDENDWLLAKQWLQSTKSYDLERMISARSAEKVAESFYSNLGYKVKDTALGQLSGKTHDWKNFDLLLDDGTALDVKNARSRRNSKTYVEHLVPKFKQNRMQEDVIIVGVKSPYLRLSHIEEPTTIPPYWNDTNIIFLGEITRNKIKKLSQEFQSPLLETILVPGARYKSGEVIPPWLFQFPIEFYKKYNLDINQKEGKYLTELDVSDFVNFKDLGFSERLISIFMAFEIQIPESWKHHLPNWQIQFIHDCLKGIEDKNLGYVFLTILTHFLKMLSKSDIDSTYSPYSYKSLLFDSSDGEYLWPFRIYDPLETVYSLCDSLCSLWGIRTKLINFDSYKLNGKGLLEGFNSKSGESVTILAYCGGELPDKSKCGNSPLILSKHETCNQCRKLRCEKCGFCYRKCPNCYSKN